MNPVIPRTSRIPGRDLVLLLARCLLGSVMVVLGLSKALHPVDFLKILHQYGLIESPVVLNLIAATLPWFEVFCGLLLVGGIAVRGTALLSLAMLVSFTGIVLRRALALHATTGIPFCSLRFDCGCGAGEVIICHKLLENGLLLLVSGLLLATNHRRWCLRPDLLEPG